VIHEHIGRQGVERQQLVESAIEVNEWREPSTRNRFAPATTARTSSTLAGRCTLRAR